MAKKKSTRATTPRPAKRAPARGRAADGFTEEERAAMRARAQELKAARRSSGGGADDERAVLDKIAGMSAPDRAIAERLHDIVRAAAPGLSPRLWYGMPAYAKDGKVLCYFQGAQKFKTRYATLGFSDQAALDDGRLWPTAFALQELTAAEEATIRELLTRAVR